ncbi:MAG: MFS transporter, partial [Actinobacteria bacterium]|nr:MFS transporter [Actinomycetota bacterium]
MPLLTDITPLREHPAFRRLLIGGTMSGAGWSMTNFANTLQVWDATRSTTATGALGVAALVPLLVVALPGGSLADRVDRRTLAMVMTVSQTAVSALFLADALLAPAAGWLWVSYALVAAANAVAGIRQPLQQTFVPSLVTRAQLPAAMALSRLSNQATLIAGPALAGLVAGAVGVRGCYVMTTVTFAVSSYGIARLPASASGGHAARGGGRARLSDIASGLAFIWRSKALAGAFLADLNATFFALPLSLFPAINAERFGGDPRTLGLLPAAIGAGGMITAALSGPVAKLSRHGLAMLVTVSVWGAAFAVFAVASWLWLTLLALAVAGAADSFTVVFRGIIVQRVAPDEFRGRVNAADFAIGAGGPNLGSLESGLVGSLTSPVISALTGGLLAIVGG